MQDYMVSRKDARRVESGTRDMVIQDFRDRMEERKQSVGHARSAIGLLGGTCSVLAVLVLAGGLEKGVSGDGADVSPPQCTGVVFVRRTGVRFKPAGLLEAARAVFFRKKPADVLKFRTGRGRGHLYGLGGRIL